MRAYPPCQHAYNLGHGVGGGQAWPPVGGGTAAGHRRRAIVVFVITLLPRLLLVPRRCLSLVRMVCVPSSLAAFPKLARPFPHALRGMWGRRVWARRRVCRARVPCRAIVPPRYLSLVRTVLVLSSSAASSLTLAHPFPHALRGMWGWWA